MSILVCIPTARDIHSRTTEAAFRVCAGHAGGVEFCTIEAQPADYSRNLGVRRFRESRHSHIFFLDSDVVPPDDSLALMLAAGRPIVCGVYPLLLGRRLCTSVAKRNDTGELEFLGELPGQPFEVDAAGMGCCLIERSVFDRLEYPWFTFRHQPGGGITGEDIHFFEQAARAGLKPLVIPQVQCSHFKTIDLLEVIRVVWSSRARQPDSVMHQERHPVDCL